MGNTQTHHHHHHHLMEKSPTEKDNNETLNRSSSLNEPKYSSRRNSRVKERVLKRFYKKSSKDRQNDNKNDLEYEFTSIVPSKFETVGKIGVTDKFRSQDHEEKNDSMQEHILGMKPSDTDDSLSTAFNETPSADLDWSSTDFSNLKKSDVSSDTLASIIRDILRTDETDNHKRDDSNIKIYDAHNINLAVIDLQNDNPNSIHSSDSDIDELITGTYKKNDLLDCIMAEIDEKQQQIKNVAKSSKFEQISEPTTSYNKNEKKLATSPTLIDYTKETDGNKLVAEPNNNIVLKEPNKNNNFQFDTFDVDNNLTNTNTNANSIQIGDNNSHSKHLLSDILRSVDDGSGKECLQIEKLEKSEIDFKQSLKLNLNSLKTIEDIKLLYKIIESTSNHLDKTEKLILIQTDSWKTAKFLESISEQKPDQQRYSFTDEQSENYHVIKLRESSTESESIFTDPITSPSCATDNDTTFKSIENGSDSLRDSLQFSINNSIYKKRQKHSKSSSKLEKLSRSEIIYLNIDSSSTNGTCESPEDDLEMAIHLRNKLAQMLSSEDQKPRSEITTSPGIFNVARAKKVELQNLSSRLADNNIAGISPKILQDIQGTSSQSISDNDTECSQTVVPSCFGSFGDSNVLKKVASFITAEKSGNNDITPKKSMLISEKLNILESEKFEGQMLVKWLTNSLQTTECNLSEQTFSVLTQQFCANLLSIGVIKPICEKTDKNETFNPYQMYQWAHKEYLRTSNPVTPGRLDAEIIWPHSFTPTSSLKFPRSGQSVIPGESDVNEVYNSNNNNYNNNNYNNINNNNCIVSNNNFKINSINTNNLNNNSSNKILCGDRKVFELKKSLLNCNTLSEVYEVVETLLPDRKPSSSIIVSVQSPNGSPSALLNETEVTLYGAEAEILDDSEPDSLNDDKFKSIENDIISTRDVSLESTQINSIHLCCKCGENISSANITNVITEAVGDTTEKLIKIDKIIQTSFDEKETVEEINEELINNDVDAASPKTPNNREKNEFIEAVNNCLVTSTPSKPDEYLITSTPAKPDEYLITSTPAKSEICEKDEKIPPVEKFFPPPPPPPPIPPPAPPLPILLIQPPSKIPPPPALPNFNNLRSISGSLTVNQNTLNPCGSFRSPQNLQKIISTGSSTSPPSPAPFPMPPSSGSWFQSNNTLRKNAVNPPKPMKPLYWTRIVAPKPLFFEQSSEEKTDSSPEEETKDEKPKELWQEIDETNLDNFVIDEFTDLFSRQAIVPQNKPTRVKSNLAKTIKILDSKRSQSVGIFYRSLHFDLEEIEHAIYNCDTSVVSLEILHHIMDIKATTEELAMIKEAALGGTPLDLPEQFLLRISQISSSAERISCLVFQAEFDEGSTLVYRKLEVVKRLSEFLTESDDLKLLFSIILTLGNYMNGGNRARGQADGFGLEILGKLKDVKSKDSKITLLHFIVKTYIGRKRKSGTPLVEIGLPIPEPSDVERAAAVDFDEVTQHIMDLQKKLRICQNTTEKVISSSNEENIQPFKDKMDDFVLAGDLQIEKQLNKLEESKESFTKTMKFYHFIPKSGDLTHCTPAQFFEFWTNFTNDFKDIWKKEITMLTNELIKKVKSQQKVQIIQNAASSSRPKLKPGGLKDRLQRMAKK